MKNRIFAESEAVQPVLKKPRLLDLRPSEWTRGVVVEDDENEHHRTPPATGPQNEICLLSSPHDASSILSSSPRDASSIVSCDSTADWENQVDLAAEALQIVESEIEAHEETPLTLSDLPDDILTCVGAFLNVGSLQAARSVSKRFCRVLSSDDAGWTAHCLRLWKRKVHVSQDALRLYHDKDEAQTNALKAFRASCTDAQLRHAITPRELLFDPARGCTTVWDFRFKAAAGNEWTASDPWHAGHKARRMVFLTNGTVRQLEQEVVQDMHHPESSRIVSRLRLPFHDATNPGGVEITWKFVSQPLDLPAMTRGAYIRLTVNGRDVPTYVVHRSPTGNWGFLMENCWGVFASFSLPQRPTHAETQPNDTPAISKGELLDDGSLPVTSQRQWREALMYNLGASRLPHGPTATRDFDRAWRHVAQQMKAHGLSTETMPAR